MNEQSPLISIIVPVYNAEKYLNQCIESVLAQTYKHLEIILVDDGSSDGSGAICDNWSKQDSRIKVIHKPNGGASSARNAGLDVAKGEYIGFVDSDDFIHKDMFSCLLKHLLGSQIKIASCQLSTVAEDGTGVLAPLGNENGVKSLNVRETINEIYAFRMGTSFCRRLFHASVLEEIRFPEGEINEEYPLLIPIAVKAGGTISVNRVLYYYRDRSDSVTGTVHASFRTLKIVALNIKRMKQQEEEYGLTPLENFPRFVAQNSFFMLLSILKNHEVLEGELKEIYYEYMSLAKQNKGAFLKEKTISFKNKILFRLIISGLYKRIRRTKIK